jgi:hypothetical protein
MSDRYFNSEWYIKLRCRFHLYSTCNWYTRFVHVKVQVSLIVAAYSLTSSLAIVQCWYRKLTYGIKAIPENDSLRARHVSHSRVRPCSYSYNGDPIMILIMYDNCGM